MQTHELLYHVSLLSTLLQFGQFPRFPSLSLHRTTTVFLLSVVVQRSKKNTLCVPQKCPPMTPRRRAEESRVSHRRHFSLITETLTF